MRDADIYCAIGRRLRARRRLMAMTQEQVGRRCGLTFQQIQKYEAGQVAISAARLVTLAVALEVPVAALMDVLDSSAARAEDSARLQLCA
jgi:transcriptional regulator with XRE-family HTH domain